MQSILVQLMNTFLSNKLRGLSFGWFIISQMSVHHSFFIQMSVRRLLSWQLSFRSLYENKKNKSEKFNAFFFYKHNHSWSKELKEQKALFNHSTTDQKNFVSMICVRHLGLLRVYCNCNTLDQRLSKTSKPLTFYGLTIVYEYEVRFECYDSLEWIIN